MPKAMTVLQKLHKFFNNSLRICLFYLVQVEELYMQLISLTARNLSVQFNNQYLIEISLSSSSFETVPLTKIHQISKFDWPVILKDLTMTFTFWDCTSIILSLNISFYIGKINAGVHSKWWELSWKAQVSLITKYVCSSLSHLLIQPNLKCK